MWYFPLKARLQRLFMSSKTAEDMRWHEEKRVKEEGIMRDPADSIAWKDFDKQYPNFAKDSRNVRLGLATDGFNPFGNMSNSYSMWPVILVPYNLPAYKFMRKEFLILSLLIPSPHAPGKELDVFLRPAINDLKDLFHGISTYDAYSGQNFQMRAAILWTISDFPAYGYLSGWSTSGYKACPCCLDDTVSQRLRGKICFMGHRRLLNHDHCWRKLKAHFDGTIETRSKPKEFSGEQVLRHLNSLAGVFGEFGKNPVTRKKGVDKIQDGKLMGLKTHDYHVLLQRLIPVGIRGYLCKEVNEAIFELSEFFRDLCSKTLKMDDLERLEKNAPLILCKLEKIFPPAFFDIMIHLIVHLPKEAKLGGPVHPRWMFPFERHLGSLKKYVRNRARPKGSIAEGYIANECLTFMSKYLYGIETKFTRKGRNYDYNQDKADELVVSSLSVRPFGLVTPPTKLSQVELDVAHKFILNNYDEIEEYRIKHKEMLQRIHPKNVDSRHEDQFTEWFKDHINQLHIDKSLDVSEELWALANVCFHTRDRDDCRTTQNSGLVVEGDHKGKHIDFYGFVKAVVELTFFHAYKVVLLQCEWYNTCSTNTIKSDRHFVTIDIRSRWYQNDPFVLPNQVQQVFYIGDTKLGRHWRIVQRVQHRHLWNLPDLEENDGDVLNGDTSFLDELLQQNETRTVLPIVEDAELGLLSRQGVEIEVVLENPLHTCTGEEEYGEEDNVFKEDGLLIESSDSDETIDMDIDLDSA
ncbi:uncharacterized protein [Coffea arabica]|uniref:DUF4218 domain-containing protein n=1 Tax=Coffea arabica TaxID=13443 RepID=A0ABM4UFE3_COFAR